MNTNDNKTPADDCTTDSVNDEMPQTQPAREETKSTRLQVANTEAEAVVSTAEAQPDAVTAADADPGPQYATGLRLWSAVLAICLVLLAIPRITNDFHSLNDVGWYGAAYQLASAPMQPMSGKLYTYFSTKACLSPRPFPWTFLTFFFLFELGSLICGVAQSSAMLIVGRVVAGLGVAGLQNGSLTILVGLAPLAKRAFLTGIAMGIGQLGIVAGPLLGGVFTEYATWRWCFYINLPIGALVAVLIVALTIPEQTAKLRWFGPQLPAGHAARQLRLLVLHRFDLGGLVLFAAATVQLLLALQWGGNQYAWSSAVVIGLLAGAGAAAAVWLAWNYRQSHRRGGGDSPKTDDVTSTNVDAANTNVNTNVNADAATAATTTTAAAATVDHRLGENALVPLNIARRRAVWAGALTMLPLMGSVVTTSYFLAIYFQAVRGATPVRSGVDPYLAIQNYVTPQEVSIALGLLTFAQNLGGALLLTVANTVFDNSLASQLRAHVPAVDAAAVIAAGATGFRAIVPADSVPGVEAAYATSVDRVFYLAAGLTVASFAATWGLGWKDIRETKTAPADEKV
ncbi:MFS multidrug transporter [Niveomyces insectorum RCEF 264]|uniref:MFS multidrug transporter n=1 Tax=Niveomyces insectorum RCEF 264 TaxID=1081102 RepID=A0A167LT69_9HYPO|nr:MFS multidrug transporter [Niveomyces insectorum RCEF 264]